MVCEQEWGLQFRYLRKNAMQRRVLSSQTAFWAAHANADAVKQCPTPLSTGRTSET